MSSKSEQVIAGLFAAVEVIPGLTGVYRSRADAFSRREAPALVVEPLSHDPKMASICRMEWTDQIAFAIYTRGGDLGGLSPDQQSDPIRVALHRIIMQQRYQVAGIDVTAIMPGKVTRELEAGDVPAMWTVCWYWVSYRTPIDDLEDP
jgi:hypothetical protein